MNNSLFLYENRGAGTSVELRPGVAYCLRHFYSLVEDLVRGAWTRYIRRHNHEALGNTSDLAEFLFGNERADLSVVRAVLEDVQAGRCFYCHRAIPQLGVYQTFAAGGQVWMSKEQLVPRRQNGDGGVGSGRSWGDS